MVLNPQMIVGKNYFKTTHKQKKFGHLLEVAREMFIFQSNIGFSTADIAKKMNMAQANIYNYINSKRDLWFAIDLQYQYTINKKFHEISNYDLPSFDRFMLMIKNFYNFVRTHPDHVFFSYKTIPPPAKEIGPFELEKKKFGRSNLIILEDVLKEGEKSGEFKHDMNSKSLIFQTWSTVYGSVNYYIVSDLFNPTGKHHPISYKNLKESEELESDVINFIEANIRKFLNE